MSEEKKQLKISGILEDLDNGLGRKEIAEKYEISLAELKMHFEHPKLKGRKPKKKLVAVYALVDDTIDPNQTEIPNTEMTASQIGIVNAQEAVAEVEKATVEVEKVADPFPKTDTAKSEFE